VDPLGVAVNVIVVPLTNVVAHVAEQLRPGGELTTVPAPVPAKVTVKVGPVPVKQTTFAVIDPVTTAPDEDTVPALFVVTVAETREVPQTRPVAVKSPEEVTVTICVSFDAHVTWLVMSLVTGG
jgi:hypothetical protein